MSTSASRWSCSAARCCRSSPSATRPPSGPSWTAWPRRSRRRWPAVSPPARRRPGTWWGRRRRRRLTETSLLSGGSGGPSIPQDGTLLGALFESLVTLSVRVYAQAAEASVHHFRTSDGEHEVDLIV